MISEPTRQAAAAASETSGVHASGSADMHAGLERYAKKESTSSDRLGSVLETTSHRRPSIFSSAPSIESSTTVGSSSSTRSPSRKDSDQETPYLTTSDFSGYTKQSTSEDMFTFRQSCRYNCHCTCHEEMVEKPQRRFGRQRSPKIGCTDAACLGNEIAQDKSEEHSSLFRSALYRATSVRVIQVRYDLQSFRMVPNGSNAVRFVNHGNLPKLKECIESGEATIWDTTLDGWSLLHACHPAR